MNPADAVHSWVFITFFFEPAGGNKDIVFILHYRVQEIPVIELFLNPPPQKKKAIKLFKLSRTALVFLLTTLSHLPKCQSDALNTLMS